MPSAVDHVRGRRSLSSALSLSLALVVLALRSAPAAATSGAPNIQFIFPFPPIVTIGQSIGIAGTNLGGPSSPGNATGQVSVNGISWPIQFGDDLTIQVQVPNNATSGTLVIQNSFGSFIESTPIVVNAGPPSPLPVLTSLMPSTVTAAAVPVTLVATGSAFVSTSVIDLNGSPITTVYNSSTQLTGTVPATLTQSGGTFAATVFTPTPGGGTSAPQTFTLVNPVPHFSSFAPATATVGSAFTLTINGSGFDALTTLNLGGSVLPTTFVNTGQLTVPIPFNFEPFGVTVGAQLANPTPGGGSASATFTFLDPAPQLSGLVPANGVVGGAALTVSLVGSGFTSNAQVQFDGSVIADQFVNPGLLTVTVPSSALAVVTGTAHTFMVIEPPPGGGSSTTFVWEVTAGLPERADPSLKVTVIPLVLPPFGVLHVGGPVQLQSGGVVTVPTILDGEGGASLSLPAGTHVFQLRDDLFRTRDVYTGLIRPPTLAGSLLGGTVQNAIFFDEPGSGLTFDQPVRVTIPAPVGNDPNGFQAVFVNGDTISYLASTVTGAAVAFDTLHLSTFGLAKVLSPTVRSATPSYTSAAGFHARWAGQSDYVSLRPGQLVDLTVRYVNAGDRTWTRGSLGSAQPDLAANAPRDNTLLSDSGIVVTPYRNPNRFATSNEATVPPGAVGSFTFRARAPSAPGVYRLDLGLVIDGVTWLEDEGVFLQLTVTP